ncbi:RNA-directed DNA polymerase, eukaryota [Tanacetum coccineum]
MELCLLLDYDRAAKALRYGMIRPLISSVYAVKLRLLWFKLQEMALKEYPKHMESVAALAMELSVWNKVADFYKRATDLYNECMHGSDRVAVEVTGMLGEARAALLLRVNTAIKEMSEQMRNEGMIIYKLILKGIHRGAIVSNGVNRSLRACIELTVAYLSSRTMAYMEVAVAYGIVTRSFGCSSVSLLLAATTVNNEAGGDADSLLYKELDKKVYGTWLPTNTKVLFVAIYAPQQIWCKRLLWDYVSSLIDRWNGEVVVLGDFNEVRVKEERRGSGFNATSARVFDQFITGSGLVDVKMEGYAFTWTHPSGSKMSKLDRFLVSGGIFSLFPSITSICLDRHLSDHHPIVLREVLVDFGHIPFRFYHS